MARQRLALGGGLAAGEMLRERPSAESLGTLPDAPLEEIEHVDRSSETTPRVRGLFGPENTSDCVTIHATTAISRLAVERLFNWIGFFLFLLLHACCMWSVALGTALGCCSLLWQALLAKQTPIRHKVMWLVLIHFRDPS